MLTKFIYASILTLLIYVSAAAQQGSGNQYHFQGLIDLKGGKVDTAEKSFEYSAKYFSYAPSYFELAKIESGKNTTYGRDKARDYIQKAIWADPENIEYRMLKAKLMESFGSSMAYDVYEGILDIDSNNTEALYNMGRISEEQFYEYHNSFMKYEEGSVSYDDYAYKYFLNAVKYFRKAIVSDAARTDAYLHLSYLYSESGLFEYGIPLLKKVMQLEPADKNACLFLGYLYYKSLSFDSCQSYYKKALELMTVDERKDFIDSTTMMLAGDKDIEPDKIDKIVNDFWNSRDPLFLSKYNERLLEHFSRVAYSNIMFSVAKQNVKGWKSDRGEVMVRYGEPENRLRLRPYIEAGGKTQIMLKTDLWVYKNKTFGFTDEYWNKNFRFSEPNSNGRYFSQFQFDTYSYVNNLRRIDPEEYEPKFKGPVFTLPYTVVQFKDLENEDNGNTRIYVNYALNMADKIGAGNKSNFQHQSGLFITDAGNNKIAQKIADFSSPGNQNELRLSPSEKYWVNSLGTDAKPDSVSLAFEVIRKTDGGVSSNHFKFLVKGFDDRNLDVSDIVLANDIQKKSTGSYPLTRKNVGMMPNPTQTFNHNMNIFLYYEVYNLKQDESRKTDFEQRITMKKVKDSSFIDDIFSTLSGLFSSRHNDEITLATNYQSTERNTQVYLQLNMNNYLSGDYIITVTVNDKHTGIEKSSQTLLRWR